jgi:hypothetical protein
MKLYDKTVLVPVEKWEEVPVGIYHWPMVRILFDLNLPTTSNGEVDISRCFFPDFPFLADVNGQMFYFNKGFYPTGVREDCQDKSFVMMRPINGKGFIFECHGYNLVLPRRVYYQEERLPLSNNVIISYFDANRVEILTDEAQDSILYYSDLYDYNWKATIDGKPTKILIANHVFKAVRLPKGRHRVVFKYSVAYLSIALCLYYGCIALIGIIGLFALKRSRGAKSQ